MENKSLFKSRTFWFFFLTIIFNTLNQVNQFIVLSQFQTEILLMAVSLVGILLRWITTKPIAERQELNNNG